MQRNRFAHFRIGHSDRQQDYLQWKASRLNQIFGKDKKRLGPYEVGCGTGEQRYQHYLYCIDDHALFEPYLHALYAEQNGKRKLVVTAELLGRLDLQALAVYWCDDGSLWSSERQKRYVDASGGTRLYPYVEGRGVLSTCRYSDAEVALIRDWVASLTGVTPVARKQRQYPVLSFSKGQLREFLPVIAPHVPECMNHKIDPSHCRVR